jgi:anti-sigma B factor antagonist
MGLEFTVEDGVAILRPEGELIGGPETAAFESKVEELCRSQNTILVINLSRVPHMTTQAIGALVKAYVSYTKRGARVRLCGVSDRVHHIFAVTRLTLIFGEDCNQDERKVIASLTG